jgi:signal transduction histidine kinase
MDDARLRPNVELTVYRIAQEALTNVLRHSGSRTATVALVTSVRQVRLTVSDEGRGAPRRGPRDRGGVGLASMRARVRNLGGSLKLAFRSTGTVLTATVPRAPATGSSARPPELHTVSTAKTLRPQGTRSR